MSVIFAPENYGRWLHDTGDVSDLLKPYLSELMGAIAEPDNLPTARDRDGFLFP
jgi:hypothetical protein